MSAQDPHLTLERYAEALAFRRAYPPSDHAAVLKKLGVATEAFERAQEHWPREMASTLQRGDASLHLTFARVYTDVETRLRLVRPKLDAIRPHDGLETKAQRAAVRNKGLRPLPPKPAAEATPAVATAIPTYLQPHRQGEAAASPVEAYTPPAPSSAALRVEDIDVDETGAVDPRKLGGSILPFLEGRPNIPPPAAPEPRPTQRTSEGATEELDPAVIARAIALFGPGAPKPPSSEPARSSAHAVTTMAWPSAQAPSSADVAAQPMTLERYAAVSAELASGEQAEVLARLGIARETWVAAMSNMAARFRSEPELEARYRELMRGLLGISRPG